MEKLELKHISLYRWRFDIYGLIDKGLAVPVTETFNPYKL